MKPIVIIKGPMFSTEDDERAFKKRLDDMRQDGYHVIGITSNKEERIAVRVFKTGWFSQLLHFLRERASDKAWERANEQRKERDEARQEIKRLQDLALQHGATPHEIHGSETARKLARRGWLNVESPARVVGFMLLGLCLALSGCGAPTAETQLVQKDATKYKIINTPGWGQYTIVEIDGCEYISRHEHGMVHKANCSNPIHQQPCR